jgi:AraC-like DNA-binding protein
MCATLLSVSALMERFGGETDVPPAPPKLLRFSTEMLPERDRVAAFREEFARQVLNMDVLDFGGGRPRIDVMFLKLGTIGVGSCVGSMGEFVRDARHYKDGVDDFQLVVITSGKIRVRQAGHDHLCGVGSAALMYHGRAFRSGATVNTARAENVSVPAAALKDLVAHPEDRAGYLVRPGPALDLLNGYLQSLTTLDEPPSAELGHLIGLHLLDLVAAAIGPTAEGREIIATRGLKAARLRAVLADIARRCGNPAFDIDGVAQRLGLSRRSVQRLLEETGQSFTEHVTERRLWRAYAMLSDPACSQLRIIDIALAAGFSDVSNFNRLFRRRFGETPSGIRAVERNDPS